MIKQFYGKNEVVFVTTDKVEAMEVLINAPLISQFVINKELCKKELCGSVITDGHIRPLKIFIVSHSEWEEFYEGMPGSIFNWIPAWLQDKLAS